MRFGEFDLHDYQIEAVEAVEREFASGRRSTLLVLATGLGKTVVKGAVAARRIAAGGRVLVLAHRAELIEQAADKMRRMGMDPKIEKASQRVHARDLFGAPSLVVGSVQTMQGDRLATWDPTAFDLVAIDEAHRTPANSYKAIFRHFEGAHRLGVTATPDRADGELLAEIFETVAYQRDLEAAVKAGQLARLRVVRCATGVDLSALHTVAGDLDEGELDEAVRANVERLANATRQEIGSLKTVIFTPRVASAELMASALSSMGISAKAISGETVDRSAVLRQFREGRFQVLVNCALLTEGWDEPSLGAVVLARPTKSRGLLAQMVGRGTRLAPGKTEVLIVDFSWTTGRHKLAVPMDLFPGDPDEEVRSRAAALVASGEIPDILEALEEARRRLEAERLAAREAAARKAEAAKARAATAQVNAKQRAEQYDREEDHDPYGRPGERAETEGDAPALLPEEAMFGLPPLSDTPELATEGQLSALHKFKVNTPARLSRRRASRLLDVLIGRSRRGLATTRQLQFILRNGLRLGVDRAEALRATVADASAWIQAVIDRTSRPSLTPQHTQIGEAVPF